VESMHAHAATKKIKHRCANISMCSDVPSNSYGELVSSHLFPSVHAHVGRLKQLILTLAHT